MVDQRLRKSERLTLAKEFERVHARKCRVRGKWLVVAGCENGSNVARLGLAIGKRWGMSHQRVKLKRWFREAFRQIKSELPNGIDYLLMPASTEGMSLATLRQELPELARKLQRRLESQQAV